MWAVGKKKTWFERLCETEYPSVLRYLYLQLRDEWAAREVTQEVFLLACQKEQELSKHPNPGGFLFRTAQNLARKYRREAYLQLTREPLTETGEPPEQADGDWLERELDRQVDEQAYLGEVFSRLSPEQYQLYALHYLQKVPMKEVAARYGLREETVRMRYLRLRKQIRQIAEEVAEKNFPV